jgi:type II secretory pathway component PulF
MITISSEQMTDVFTIMKNLFTDLSPIIMTVLGLAFGFIIVEVIVNLITPRDVREDRA